MFHYTPPQARTYSVNVELPNANRTSPWNAMTPTLAPAFRPSVQPSYPGDKAAMPEGAVASPSWRVIATPQMPQVQSGASSLPVHPQAHKPASVKHLTCYFWAKNGACKFSEENCLYAHRDTGKIAQGPLQVELGCRFLSQRPHHLSSADRNAGPAVAGKNATAAKPVYQNWRGSAYGSSPGSKSSHGTITDPDIQEQLRYIAAKAKIHESAFNPNAANMLSNQRRQIGPNPPMYTLYQDSQFQNRPSPSLSTADQILETQIQALTKAAHKLSTTTEGSMKVFDNAASILHQEVEALVDIYRTVVPHPNHPDYPAHIDKMASALHQITRVALDLSNMACVLNDTRMVVTKELGSAGLRHLAPVWQHRQR